MRTNIVIDDALLSEALSCTGLSTKKAVIEEALRTLVRLKSQEQVRSLRGHLRWEGDLHAMRESRVAYEVNTSAGSATVEDDSDVDR
ncbi:MAG: type II toxin-antitoxin system VapB family antitoxin [Caldilinea sp. CFX5]|nr:type II toxin-antitoxin system VapB family antitoxin [Caldilinea sp. CFX5]